MCSVISCSRLNSWSSCGQHPHRGKHISSCVLFLREWYPPSNFPSLLSPHTALLLPFLHPVRYTVSCFWVHSLPSVPNTTTLVLGVPVSHLDCGCISVFVFQPSSLVLSNPSFFTPLPDESEENCKLYQDYRKTEIKARGFLCSLYEATVGKCWRFVGLFVQFTTVVIKNPKGVFLRQLDKASHLSYKINAWEYMRKTVV